MTFPEASVILLTKNAGCGFRHVLEAVFAQESLDFEVVLIDSGSTDGTVKVAREFPIRLYNIAPEDFGHGKTRNLGASLAKGRYLVYLTQDACPADQNWLMRLLRNLRAVDVAGVFGKQIPRPGTNPMDVYLLNVLYPEERIVKSIDRRHPLRLRDFFFSNVNSAIRRSVWQQYPFEENLIMSEDQVWAKQTLLAGYKLIYEPEAAVYHSHRYTLAKLFKRNFDSGASLKGIAEDKLYQIVCDYMKYVAGEMQSLICQRQAIWLPLMVIYEFTRGMGMILGSQYRLIPLFARRRLSMHSTYYA